MMWERKIEQIFDYKEYDEHKSFKVAELKLTSYASLWFEGLQKRRKERLGLIHGGS